MATPSPSRFFFRIFFPLLIFSVVLGGPSLVPLRGLAADTEQDLLARIQREQNPVKKSKYQSRLGELKLQQAIGAYGKKDFEQGPKLLDAYLGRMKESWDLLKSTGREAVRKPQGFRELDIALRESARLLVDLEHRVPYTDRDPVTRVAQETDRIRNEVLAALFPGGQLSH